MRTLLGALLVAVWLAPAQGAGQARAKAPARPPPPAAPPVRPAVPPPNPARERMEVLRRELEELQRQLSPLQHELENLTVAYRNVDDPRPLFDKRSALHKQAIPLLERYNQSEEEFNTLRSNADVNNVAMLVSSLVTGKGLPPGMESAYYQYNDALEFGRSARDFRERMSFAMSADDQAYASALHAFQVQQRWIMATSIAGGVLAIVIVGLLIWRRRAARTAYLVTSATGQPMLVTAEGATAGALPPPTGPVPTAPPSEAKPGDVIGGNYRVERVLGRGGMGVVYEATDLTLARKVAIKRMTDELLKAGHDLELIVNEARLVAQLKHPNIVAIHSIAREGGLLHLVFEYVEGKPLSAYLENGQRLTFKSAKGVVRQTAAALDYAHAHKVVHRDLKPSNIMVAAGGVAKVMDFGIAHQAKVTVAKMTRTGAWGTPPYMAPEQELGQIGRESDVFALGVCLYEMLTTRIPFTGPNFLAQKRERIYKPATKLVPGLPPALDPVIAKVLAPDPKERYRSAGDFSAALDALPD